MHKTNLQEQHLRTFFFAALKAVAPQYLIPAFMKMKGEKLIAGDEIIDLSVVRNIYLAGAGKAALQMGAAIETILNRSITEGLLVIRDEVPTNQVHSRIIKGGHPLPDQNSLLAATEITKLIRRAGKEDLVIFLISGGASALLTDLPGEISLEDLVDVFQLLSRSGASITELNTLRKHLSAIKGGQLIKHAPEARWLTLTISDVIHDDLQVIGSGPTVGDPTTFSDALEVLHRYQLHDKIPVAVREYLNRGVSGEIADTPKPGDALFKRSSIHLIGTNSLACRAAAAAATQYGYTVDYIPGHFNGHAESIAHEMVDRIRAVPAGEKTCLIAGGETSVVIRGKGKGGRNQQLALAAAIEMEGSSGISLLAAGTDGSDGPTDATGAIVSAQTIAATKERGMDAQAYLDSNDAYTLFKETGGLIFTGPTGTNVMDMIIAVKE